MDSFLPNRNLRSRLRQVIKKLRAGLGMLLFPRRWKLWTATSEILDNDLMAKLTALYISAPIVGDLNVQVEDQHSTVEHTGMGGTPEPSSWAAARNQKTFVSTVRRLAGTNTLLRHSKRAFQSRLLPRMSSKSFSTHQ